MTTRPKRIKVFVAVTGDGYNAGVEPRQKAGLNSIPWREVGLPWILNLGFLSRVGRGAQNCGRWPRRARVFRAVIGGCGDDFSGIFAVYSRRLPRRCPQEKRPAHGSVGGSAVHGARVRWGNNEAIQTKWPIRHREHKGGSGSEELGELSCRTGDGCGPESGFWASKSERACSSCSAQWSLNSPWEGTLTSARGKTSRKN